MPIYHYKNSPLIDRIEVKSPRPGVAHATIVVRENVDAAGLEQLRATLAAKSLSTLMDTKNGRAAIQVRGLKDEKPLFAALCELGLAESGMEKEETADDRKKVGLYDRVRGKSLFLSALFYDLGNIAFGISGLQRGRHNKGGKFTPNDISELMIGGAFSVGDILMTLYGADKGNEELHAVDVGLKRHLHSKGIQVPECGALTPDTLHQSGLVKATDRWLHKHIGRIKCLSELAGGLFTIHAGLKPGNRNNGKLLAGFLLSTGWLATFVLDKPRGHYILDGDVPESPTAAQAMANNPRGWIARPLSIGNNLSNLWGSLNPINGERKRFFDEVLSAERQMHLTPGDTARAHLAYAKNKQHDYIWNVISACSFLVANGLFGLSGSKRPHETQDDKSMMNDLVLLSANVLAKLPEKMREAAIGETAEYVSELARIGLSKEQVEMALRDKVTSLTQSAWVSRVQAPSGPGLQL